MKLKKDYKRKNLGDETNNSDQQTKKKTKTDNNNTVNNVNINSVNNNTNEDNNNKDITNNSNMNTEDVVDTSSLEVDTPNNTYKDTNTSSLQESENDSTKIGTNSNKDKEMSQQKKKKKAEKTTDTSTSSLEESNNKEINIKNNTKRKKKTTDDTSTSSLQESDKINSNKEMSQQKKKKKAEKTTDTSTSSLEESNNKEINIKNNTKRKKKTTDDTSTSSLQESDKINSNKEMSQQKKKKKAEKTTDTSTSSLEESDNEESLQESDNEEIHTNNAKGQQRSKLELIFPEKREKKEKKEKKENEFRFGACRMVQVREVLVNLSKEWRQEINSCCAYSKDFWDFTSFDLQKFVLFTQEVKSDRDKIELVNFILLDTIMKKSDHKNIKYQEFSTIIQNTVKKCTNSNLVVSDVRGLSQVFIQRVIDRRFSLFSMFLNPPLYSQVKGVIYGFTKLYDLLSHKIKESKDDSDKDCDMPIITGIGNSQKTSSLVRTLRANMNFSNSMVSSSALERDDIDRIFTLFNQYKWFNTTFINYKISNITFDSQTSVLPSTIYHDILQINNNDYSFFNEHFIQLNTPFGSIPGRFIVPISHNNHFSLLVLYQSNYTISLILHMDSGNNVYHDGDVVRKCVKFIDFYLASAYLASISNCQKSSFETLSNLVNPIRNSIIGIQNQIDEIKSELDIIKKKIREEDSQLSKLELMLNQVSIRKKKIVSDFVSTTHLDIHHPSIDRYLSFSPVSNMLCINKIKVHTQELDDCSLFTVKFAEATKDIDIDDGSFSESVISEKLPNNSQIQDYKMECMLELGEIRSKLPRNSSHISNAATHPYIVVSVKNTLLGTCISYIFETRVLIRCQKERKHGDYSSLFETCSSFVAREHNKVYEEPAIYLDMFYSEFNIEAKYVDDSQALVITVGKECQARIATVYDYTRNSNKVTTFSPTEKYLFCNDQVKIPQTLLFAFYISVLVYEISFKIVNLSDNDIKEYSDVPKDPTDVVMHQFSKLGHTEEEINKLNLSEMSDSELDQLTQRINKIKESRKQI